MGAWGARYWQVPGMHRNSLHHVIAPGITDQAFYAAFFVPSVAVAKTGLEIVIGDKLLIALLKIPFFAQIYFSGSL